MSAGWVAGSVRARALARRRVGSEAARRIARAGSLPVALDTLASTPYGRDIRPGQSLAEAQHMAARTLLWNLRVLTGWLPRDGVAMLRTLAAWFEIANTDELIAGLSGAAAGPVFDLGALATAWSRLRAAGSLTGLRAALAASAWGDPGGQDPRTIRLSMRASWAARAATLPGPGASWAIAAAALLAAGERFAAQRELSGSARSRLSGLLPAGALAAPDLGELTRRLPVTVRWVLPPHATPGDLWQAQARWWARIERDGFALLASPGFASDLVLGAAAVLAADAWRLRAALEMASRAGHPLAVYDAIAYSPVIYDGGGYGAEAPDAPA